MCLIYWTIYVTCVSKCAVPFFRIFFHSSIRSIPLSRLTSAFVVCFSYVFLFFWAVCFLTFFDNLLTVTFSAHLAGARARSRSWETSTFLRGLYDRHRIIFIPHCTSFHLRPRLLAFMSHAPFVPFCFAVDRAVLLFFARITCIIYCVGALSFPFLSHSLSLELELVVSLCCDTLITRGRFLA